MENFVEWFYKWVMNTPKTLAKDKNKAIRILADVSLVPWSAITLPLWLPVSVVLLISFCLKEWYDNV